jgi:hypothetical protein
VADPATVSRDYAASLNSLLVLSMLMFESAREDQIFHLATSCLPALAPGCELIGIRHLGAWAASSPPLTRERRIRDELALQIDAVAPGGGPLVVDGDRSGTRPRPRRIGPRRVADRHVQGAGRLDPGVRQGRGGEVALDAIEQPRTGRHSQHPRRAEARDGGARHPPG